MIGRSETTGICPHCQVQYGHTQEVCSRCGYDLDLEWGVEGDTSSLHVSAFRALIDQVRFSDEFVGSQVREHYGPALIEYINWLSALPSKHTRTATEGGPDTCEQCSRAAENWVKWPCPEIAEALG